MGERRRYVYDHLRRTICQAILQRRNLIGRTVTFHKPEGIEVGLQVGRNGKMCGADFHGFHIGAAKVQALKKVEDGLMGLMVWTLGSF